jgi:hypothetical protein
LARDPIISILSSQIGGSYVIILVVYEPCEEKFAKHLAQRLAREVMPLIATFRPMMIAQGYHLTVIKTQYCHILLEEYLSYGAR